MYVIIVGVGKLATELLAMQLEPQYTVVPWENRRLTAEKSIVIHAGSGRQLPEVIDFCRTTGSVLVELSTGTALPEESLTFPLIHCPNVNILMLKFMSMLQTSGHLFNTSHITLAESHQMTKTSLPGTAAAMGTYLGLPLDAIRSVRDPQIQESEFGVPQQHLARHAIHRIEIADGACQLRFESRVFGSSPYADGTARIIDAISNHQPENRRYEIMELVNAGWL